VNERTLRACAPILIAAAAASCNGGDGNGAAVDAAPDLREAAADIAAPDAPAPDAPAPDAPAPDVAPDAAAPIPGGEVAYTETRAPCTARNPLRNAYFGDLHVHTSLSFDAYTLENRNGPDGAYRFARGEEIRLAPAGADGMGTRPVRIDRPLDFAAATDHSEFLGEVNLCTTMGSSAYGTVTCRAYREELGMIPERVAGALAFGLFGSNLIRPMPDRNATVCGLAGAQCAGAAGRVWQGVQMAAEGAYDRTASCRFTSFVAYEWTGTTGGSNLHRNVIFRNARVPALPVSYYEQPTPAGLWTSLRARCTSGDGCDVLAIPHNSNLGSGSMFPADLDAETARSRAAMEPLVEVMQHKGASECNRAFTTDEACNFELLGGELCNGDGSGSGMRCVARGDFLRGAVGTGLATEARTGANPYRFGFIGSTDTHNSTPGNTRERPFVGHTGTNDDTPTDLTTSGNIVFNPGGLAGVWAVENSRDALFDALRRRETFATSGTRIRVRMFGGFGFTAGLCADPRLVERGYREGVPMGAVLPSPPAGARPTFVVQATADEAPLQRVEVIKVWLDAMGRPQERVVVVAGSATNGATVDPRTCATAPGAGQMSYCATWTDDQYNPAERASYYARVLENPTCRWSAPVCDALPPDAPPANQHRAHDPGRAWSSPIWSTERSPRIAYDRSPETGGNPCWHAPRYGVHPGSEAIMRTLRAQARGRDARRARRRRGATVGSVVPTDRAIIPAAVGVDIGCGMIAARTSSRRRDLPDSLRRLRSAIERPVPHGRTDNGGSGDRGAWRRRARRGGRGVGDAARWLRGRARGEAPAGRPRGDRGAPRDARHGQPLHRAVPRRGEACGSCCTRARAASATASARTSSPSAREEMTRWFVNLPDQDLAYLPEGTAHFDDYLAAVGWAQDFARTNRELMMRAAVDALRAHGAAAGLRGARWRR
jgi:hypothetical protein